MFIASLNRPRTVQLQTAVLRRDIRDSESSNNNTRGKKIQIPSGLTTVEDTDINEESRLCMKRKPSEDPDFPAPQNRWNYERHYRMMDEEHAKTADSKRLSNRAVANILSHEAKKATAAFGVKTRSSSHMAVYRKKKARAQYANRKS